MLSSCPVLLWWCSYMQHACYKGQNRLVFTGCSIIEPPGRCPVIDHQKMPFDRRQKCSFPAEPDMLLLPETFRRVFQKAVQKKKGEQRSRRRIPEIKRMILSNYEGRQYRRICLYSHVERFNYNLLKSGYQQGTHITQYMTGRIQGTC